VSTDSILGQHLALPIAAHLARTQLVPDPLSVYDAQHLADTLNAVANALAKVAPLYVQDPTTGLPRELAPGELDGRPLSSVSMKRADLRQAIAILKAVGVPELRPARAKDLPRPKAEPPPLLAHLTELESLLRLPLIAPHVEKANALAVTIARQARHGRVANLAMQLVSAVHEASRDETGTRRVNVALARLRAVLEETDSPDRPVRSSD
jgi:hypothetical protein